MLLALDTSTRWAGVALYDETGVIAEATWRARENHTTSLMPELLRLMQISGVDVGSLRALGVATGPGSFTGLRIGLSVAKGLALARGIPLIGIATLDAAAQAFAQQPLLIWPVLQIGRGRYATAPYLPQGEQVLRLDDYFIGDSADLCEHIARRTGQAPSAGGLDIPPERALVSGELDAALRSALIARVGARIEIANPASSLRRSAYLAELAWQRWQADEISDLETLAPYYVPTPSLPEAAPR